MFEMVLTFVVGTISLSFLIFTSTACYIAMKKYKTESKCDNETERFNITLQEALDTYRTRCEKLTEEKEKFKIKYDE